MMSFFEGLFGPPNIEKLKIKGNVKGLIKALSYQKDSSLRRDAAGALGEIGDARAVEPLIGVLQDEDGSVRRRAAEALGEIGDARAVEPLISILGGADEDIRGAAVGALGELSKRLAWLGDEQAVTPLAAIVEKGLGTPALRETISSSIEIIRFLQGALNNEPGLRCCVKILDIQEAYYFLALRYRERPGFDSSRAIRFIDTNLSGECPQCGHYVGGETLTTAATMQDKGSGAMTFIFVGGGQDTARLGAGNCPNANCRSKEINLFWRR